MQNSTIGSRQVVRALLAVLVSAVLAMGVAGCAGGAKQKERVATGRFGRLHTAACEAASASAAGEREAAQRTFNDVHAGLHDLAAAVTREDRAEGTRYLEAVQAVERRGTTPDLEALAERVAAAIEATGGSAPASCP